MQLEEIKARIEFLQDELGKLIISEADPKEIYKASVELDELIVAYYRSSQKTQ